MQITNSEVCDQVNVGLYKQFKTPLLGEHAFPLTGFVCKEAHVTFGGSGGTMSTARPKLPYPCNFQSHVPGRDFSEGLSAPGLYTCI